jgi:hypothetical protein
VVANAVSQRGVPDSVARVRAANAAEMIRAIEAGSRAADTTREASDRQISLYRASTGIRPSADLPAANERTGNAPISVAQLLDSAALALPDTTKFNTYDYKPGFQPEYIARPSIGYAQDNFGRGLFGGSAIVLSDLLGNNRLTLAGQVNGRLSEAYFYAGYMSLGQRLQYLVSAAQTPFFFLSNFTPEPLGDGTPREIQHFEISRYIMRQGSLVGIRPFNRFTRFEIGASAVNVARSIGFYRRAVDYAQGFASDLFADSIVNFPSLNYVAPFAAYVSDNTLFGYTGPISGRRYRFQIEPAVGGLRWIDYSADYRKYVPILFNFLTFSWRVQSSITVGRDEAVVQQKYIGRPDFVRGYDREQFTSLCGGFVTTSCSATELLGSRVAFTNVELRFPVIRRFDLGLIPISLPPVDGLVFYDMGAAWQSGQTLYFRQPDNYNEDEQRYFLRSYGAGIRLNLFGIALLRWDYAIPLNRPQKKGYWVFSLGPSF